jgi:hypothetical protein
MLPICYSSGFSCKQQGSQVDRDRDETLPKHGGSIKSSIEPPLDLGPDLRPGHFSFLQQLVRADRDVRGHVDTGRYAWPIANTAIAAHARGIPPRINFEEFAQ